MYFVRGKDRLVLAFPALGIVAKFPVIHFWIIVRITISSVKDRAWNRLKILCLRWSPESTVVFSGMLLRGIVANRRERMLWKRTRHPFLQPTIFSLFGLFNIQLFAEPCKCKYLDLWDQIRRITEGKAYANPHQFCEPGNYCLINGKLRILDYGGQGGPLVILRYGKKIQNEFDLQYAYSGPL